MLAATQGCVFLDSPPAQTCLYSVTRKRFIDIQDYYSRRGLPSNWYSDDQLVAAGGDLDGTLDFYEVHAYPDWEVRHSCIRGHT